MKKQIFALIVTFGFVTNAYADDWRMRKFDLDSDGFVVPSELSQMGCVVKPGLFKHADKNNDGKLSKGELRKSSEYMIRHRCPKKSDCCHNYLYL